MLKTGLAKSVLTFSLLIGTLTAYAAQDSVYINDLGAFDYINKGAQAKNYTDLQYYTNFSDEKNYINNSVNEMENYVNAANTNAQNVINNTINSANQYVSKASKEAYNQYDNIRNDVEYGTQAASYNFKKGSYQDNDLYSYNGTYQGVNSSKTMYTDGIGRLHFFGKGNLIRE